MRADKGPAPQDGEAWAGEVLTVEGRRSRWGLRAFWHLRHHWTLRETRDGITWLRNLYNGPNYFQL